MSLLVGALVAVEEARAQLAEAASPPLGTGPGASRPAWAAAARLSRGIRLAGLLQGTPLDSGTISTIAKAGFRSVHLPVRWPDPPDEALARRIDATIDAMLAQDLVVVLDLRHGTRQAADPPAAGDAAAEAAWWQGRFVGLWRQVAQRHAGRGSRLMFEVSLPPEAVLPATQGNALLVQALRAIRQSNPARVVVAGWPDAVNLPRLTLPDDRHLIVGIGNPEPYRFTRQGVPVVLGAAAWLGTSCCSPQEQQLMALPLNLAQAWSQEHRYPVWIESFASSRQAPLAQRALHARLMREAAEARGFSWAYGDFNAEFGIHDPASGRWQSPLLEALLGP
ncbi:MAG: cellulase family glycosylhydrolase [Burkholderiales bacterium]|nr:cellulase family glycosylhydrolase [Burkholderiales bacterium]